jgi:DNA-binding NtrC family response regulator
MDFEKYLNLQTIIMLREVIRKWWRAELSFADSNGEVPEWQRGNIVPPANEFCKLSLGSKDGLRRCCGSVKVLHEKFRDSRKLRRAVVTDCHLNFTIAGAPIYLNGEYQGFLFVEGFARGPLASHDVENLTDRVRELSDSARDMEHALSRIPLMGAPDVEKLADLLEFASGEIAGYEVEKKQKEKEKPPEAVPAAITDRYKFENIVGGSGAMMEIFRMLEKVANSDSTVLVNGESGTGKELVARAIHYNGTRKDKPFVVQNCSAFNDNLLESALFGHTKGSFTGAIRDKKGLFEVADGGTFFLDEVGDMSPALQVKLLRVLQEGTFIPVGGNHPKEVDVRVIAATHKDLGELVKKGEFREDLYYRINVIRVQVPPLRERRDDIPLLVDHFMRKHHRPGQKAKGLSPAAMTIFTNYGWPGNIRELENEIERLLVLGSDLDLLPADLISGRIRDKVTPSVSALLPVAGAQGNLNEAVEMLEKEMIRQGLQRTNFNKSQLSRELGISRSNLILKIAKYGLDRGDGDGGREVNA